MAGKGSKPRPLSVSQKQFDDAWDRIFNNNNPLKGSPPVPDIPDPDKYWKHSCTVEMGVMFIGKNETCNYCGAWEEDDE